VDLIERITVLFNSNGSILKSEIDGCIRMKSYLQGAPELRLGLSEDLVVGRVGAGVYGATVVDDITFHQACNLSDFDRDKVNITSSSSNVLLFSFFPISSSSSSL
jgi:hypothetical protein